MYLILRLMQTIEYKKYIDDTFTIKSYFPLNGLGLPPLKSVAITVVQVDNQLDIRNIFMCNPIIFPRITSLY